MSIGNSIKTSVNKIASASANNKITQKKEQKRKEDEAERRRYKEYIMEERTKRRKEVLDYNAQKKIDVINKHYDRKTEYRKKAAEEDLRVWRTTHPYGPYRVYRRKNNG